MLFDSSFTEEIKNKVFLLVILEGVSVCVGCQTSNPWVGSQVFYH